MGFERRREKKRMRLSARTGRGEGKGKKEAAKAAPKRLLVGPEMGRNDQKALVIHSTDSRQKRIPKGPPLRKN